MSDLVHWEVADGLEVSAVAPGTEMTDGQRVDTDKLGLCVGDEVVVEGTRSELLSLAAKIARALDPWTDERVEQATSDLLRDRALDLLDQHELDDDGDCCCGARPATVSQAQHVLAVLAGAGLRLAPA